ncbi:hypothetical protein LHFGNBLO_000731 [Mesorhizobium sp. AR10]|uniref:hypothetical protein n=1 Tax=Mesorhizobium sp. AR10 TaxID=2865839 RepID=UPI00215FA774|nr:hypothetical protein [Mesorhizobium sp. AR10]UVK39371.1 hypothetical protein LHFGNBLO_000731 [Mesorhizobium sp. AR10]
MVGSNGGATFTRRAVVQALPAAVLLPLASCGAEGAEPGIGNLVLPAELLAGRIARLARELSDALNQVDGCKWFATVYPSNYVEDPVRCADIAETMEAAETVSPDLVHAIVSHCAAYAAVARAARQTDVVALGDEASLVDCRRLEEASKSERDLFMALCRFPARNDPERRDKASYLLGFCDGDELETEHVIALLESMTVSTCKSQVFEKPPQLSA